MSATASALLSELEDLRKVLDSKTPLGDTPRGKDSPRGGKDTARSKASPRSAAPSRLGQSTSYAREDREDSLPNYKAALNDAEANVDRLSKAMEAAEQEMENTFRRTTELHKNTAERREAEVQELRKVLASKERSLDNLRDTLSTTKRSLEGRAVQAETALSTRDVEVKRLREELANVRHAKKQFEGQLEQEIDNNRKHLETLAMNETAMREAEQQAELTIRRVTAENRDIMAALEVERAKRGEVEEELDRMRDGISKAQEETGHFKQKLESTKKKLHSEHKKRKELQKEAEKYSQAKVMMSDMEKRLREEQKQRVGAERWLDAELKAKEEMEALYSNIRDMAVHRGSGELTRLKQAVEDLQRDRHAPPHHLSPPKAPEPLGGVAADIGVDVHESLMRDNQRLREDLEATRREISQRLYPYPSVERDVRGEAYARCRRCGDRFSLNRPMENSCGYHPGELTANGFTCCGVTPKPGGKPVYCHWRPHVA